MIQLDFSDINDFFKLLKDNDDLDQERSRLPPYEKIIEGAQQIYIPYEHLNELFQRHEPKVKSPRRHTIRNAPSSTIIVPPKS